MLLSNTFKHNGACCISFSQTWLLHTLFTNRLIEKTLTALLCKSWQVHSFKHKQKICHQNFQNVHILDTKNTVFTVNVFSHNDVNNSAMYCLGCMPLYYFSLNRVFVSVSVISLFQFEKLR